eukprot:TRINITY_DN6016_c0_g2_i4.p1 TRINITY_DN6016_c0_g2~~TRINITY_DN6016_c0_g2_i4.p1  ORF type:complete len:516 (+),score=153.99 TRINITY_DN6016_c0_g2_i4:128-1675(+)
MDRASTSDVEEKKNEMTDLEYQMTREKRDNMCSLHPKEILRGFCKSDFSAICFRCYLELHKTHDVVMLEEISSLDLKDKISEFETELHTQTGKVSYLAEKIASSKINYDSQYEVLKKTFQEILDMCTSGQLFKEVLGEFEERKDDIGEMKKQVQELQQTIEILQANIISLKEDGANLSVYDSIKTMLNSNIERLVRIEKKLLSKNFKLANLESMDIKQVILNSIRSLLFKKECINTANIIHYFEWGNKNVIFYDTDKKATTKLILNIDFVIPKFCRTVATEDGTIFVIGGRDRQNACCDWMLEFKEEKKTLVHKKPMLLKRSDFTPVCSGNEWVYIIGGNDAKIFYKTCEKYDIENDQWIKIANLNIGRDSAACCIFRDKYIYAFSGRIKFEKKEITNTIERYSILNDVWEMVTPTSKSVWTPCDLGMAYQIDSTSLVIFGGFDKDARTQETFIFHEQTGHMERGPYLPKEGSFSNFMFKFGTSLYVVGWNNAGKNLYQYSLTERIWKIDDNLIL